MLNDKILFFKRQIFWLWVLMITMLCTSAYFLYYTVIGQAGNKEELSIAAQNVLSNLALEIIATFLTVIIFVYFYDSYTRRNSQEQVEKSIAQSILLQDDILSRFDDGTKRFFLQKVLTAIIGAKNAGILYDSLLKHHLTPNANYRDTEVYDIEILEPSDDFVLKPGTVLSKEQFYVMSQSYMATKRIAGSASEKIAFRMLFTFSEQSLDYWLKDKIVFMREIINVSNPACDLIGFTDTEINDVVKNVFGLKLKFYDKNRQEIAKKPSYSAKLTHKGLESVAIEVIIEAKEMKDFLLAAPQGNGWMYICKASFRMPLSKSKKRFHYVVSEPTHAPRFSFKHDKTFMNLDYLTYFTQAEEPFNVEKEELVNKFTFQTDKVVFPRSGIVFFWD